MFPPPHTVTVHTTPPCPVFLAGGPLPPPLPNPPTPPPTLVPFFLARASLTTLNMHCVAINRYERLQKHPHPLILTVFGICTDAPDSKLRLVMNLCTHGSVEDTLSRAYPQVCPHVMRG
jgi:hypothetical protein